MVLTGSWSRSAIPRSWKEVYPFCLSVFITSYIVISTMNPPGYFRTQHVCCKQAAKCGFCDTAFSMFPLLIVASKNICTLLAYEISRVPLLLSFGWLLPIFNHNMSVWRFTYMKLNCSRSNPREELTEGSSGQDQEMVFAMLHLKALIWSHYCCQPIFESVPF